MSKRKLAHDAFDFYFSLGPDRSYEKVAAKYGVTKRAVTKLAARESWQERLEKVEAEARTKADQKKVATLEESKEHHLKALRLVLVKGVNALKMMQFDTPMDAARAIGLAVREIRVELGEPSDRTEVNVADTIRREYERWMMASDGGDSTAKPTSSGEKGG